MDELAELIASRGKLKLWLQDHDDDAPGRVDKKHQIKAIQAQINKNKDHQADEIKKKQEAAKKEKKEKRKAVLENKKRRKEVYGTHVPTERGKRARSPTNELAGVENPNPTKGQVPAKVTKAPGSAESEDLRNLMVKDLPSGFDERDMKALFEPLGELERCKIVLETNQSGIKVSKGYGFVKFAKVSSAANAVRRLSGTPAVAETSGDRGLIVVEYANKRAAQLKVPKTPKQKESEEKQLDQEKKDKAHFKGMFASKGGDGSEDPEVLRNLIVNFLPKEMDEAALREMFVDCGLIENVKLMQEGQLNISKGFGFVKFAKAYDAAAAIKKLDGKVDGSGGSTSRAKIKVSYAKAGEAAEILHPKNSKKNGQKTQKKKTKV